MVVCLPFASWYLEFASIFKIFPLNFIKKKLILISNTPHHCNFTSARRQQLWSHRAGWWCSPIEVRWPRNPPPPPKNTPGVFSFTRNLQRGGYYFGCIISKQFGKFTRPPKTIPKTTRLAIFSHYLCCDFRREFQFSTTFFLVEVGVLQKSGGGDYFFLFKLNRGGGLGRFYLFRKEQFVMNANLIARVPQFVHFFLFLTFWVATG